MQANELFTQPNTILLDGGMGTMLQAAGLKLGARPEELNITDPQLIESIHSRYAAAGSRIINANTFGASAHKLAGSEYTLEEIIAAGIANCKRACAPYGALAALDVGPLGELLEPNGTLAFEDAVAEYGRIVRAGVAAGADLVFFETFTDLYELKAALLAAKENCDLPILASMSFEAGGRTFTGCTVESFAVTARGLGANAVGINCSLGPKEIFPMAKRLAEALPGDFPVFVKPTQGGSSFGVSRVTRAEDVVPAIRYAFSENSSVIVEQGLSGKELTCAAYFDGESVKALPVIEIVTDNEYFDYDAKYNGHSDEICPADLPDSVREEVQRKSCEIYSRLGCKGIVRVDYIYTEDGLYFLEINTIPGMTSASLVPKMVRAAGMDITSFLSTIIENS